MHTKLFLFFYRYGDLESYGHPSQESGPIDQMAREGMKFSRWYSPDVLCSPSRGAMLTGDYFFLLGAVLLHFIILLKILICSSSSSTIS